MANEALEALLTEDFEVAVGPRIQADLLWKRLSRTEVVKKLRTALDQEQVLDTEVGDFVSKIVAQFQPGQALLSEMALAGIAVALEHRGTRFAEEYLKTLAGLHLAELGTATRVARVCLRHRADRPTTERREVQLQVPTERFEVRPNIQVPLSQRPTFVEMTFHAAP